MQNVLKATRLIDWSRTRVHIGVVMGRGTFDAILAGAAALALAASSVSPCQCVSSADVCHGEGQAANAHGCCEESATPVLVSDECCDAATSVPVVASPDISKVTPPSFYVAHVTSPYPRVPAAIVAAIPGLPPLPPDRTTVLLI